MVDESVLRGVKNYLRALNNVISGQKQGQKRQIKEGQSMHRAQNLDAGIERARRVCIEDGLYVE